MGGKTLAFLRWEIGRLQRRYGWFLWCSLTLMAMSAWFLYQSALLEQESLRLSPSNIVSARPEALRPSQPVTEGKLEAYYKMLPHEEERFALVKQILLTAQKNGVLPIQADYKLESENFTRVTRYQLSLPLKGDFSKIQSFIVDVLNENRSLVIDTLSIKRESIEHADVEARIQLSILMTRL